MATIHDVAKKAGVAPITVSRVINNSGYVSDALRQKVNQAISELGYVPNVLARSLKSKRTNTIALIFTDITNPFFNTIARGVEDSAGTAGFNVIFCNTDESETQEYKYIQLVLQKQVDGILLVPVNTRSVAIDAILDQKTPLVVIDRKVPYENVDTVRGDSEGGAYLITKHLINHGHKRITMLSGPKGISTAEDRIAGYCKAMKDAGLAQNTNYYYGRFAQESGFETTKSLFSEKLKPTAIFAGNNLIAIGAFAALRELGVNVPEDVSVVSFDGIPESLTAIPFITTVDQPSYEIGKKATELLLSRIQNDPATPKDFQNIVFPVTLNVRQSSKPVLVES
jgi:LacI family transcriptional regulator